MHTYSFGCRHRFHWKPHPESSQSCARVTTAVCFKAFQVNSTKNQLFLLEKAEPAGQTSVLGSCQVCSVCGHRWWPSCCRSQRRKTKETKSCSNRRHPQFKSHESNFNRQLLEAWITFPLWLDSGCTQKTTRGSTWALLQSKLEVITLLLPFLKTAVPDSKRYDTDWYL